MSRHVSRTRVVLAIGAVASALALAGCGAGQIAQTSTQVSAVDGASANIGQIAVRGAEIPFSGDGKSAVIYPRGGSAPLSITVANFGSQPDKLTAVSSPAADSVKITGDGTVSAGRQLLVQGAPSASATPSASAVPSASASTTPNNAAPVVGSPSAEATAPGGATPALVTPSAQPTAATSASVVTTEAGVAGDAPAPTGVAVSRTPSPEGTTSAQVVLTGLKDDIKAGLTYPVVLTFERAGEVTVQVPVGNPKDPSAP